MQDCAAGPVHDVCQQDDGQDHDHQPEEEHDDSGDDVPSYSSRSSHGLQLPGAARIIRNRRGCRCGPPGNGVRGPLPSSIGGGGPRTPRAEASDGGKGPPTLGWAGAWRLLVPVRHVRQSRAPAAAGWAARPLGPGELRASGTGDNKGMGSVTDDPATDRPREWLALPGGGIRPVVSVPGPGGIAELLAYGAWLARLRPACRCGRPRLGSGRTCGSAECVAELRVQEPGR